MRKVQVRRTGVNLDQHPEYRSLQAFFEAGVRPPTHQEAADIISQMFGARDLNQSQGEMRRDMG